MGIETVELRKLSYERAKKVAPEEFLPAYDWLIDHASPTPQKLPSTQNGLDPGLSVKLIAQRGIHKPSGFDYALTIKSTATGPYDDGIIEQDDDTWILHYRRQEKGRTSLEGTDHYNEALRKCLRDGLPVGVFTAAKEQSHYYYMGLAFVEAYDSTSGVFTLHGPVKKSQDEDFWSVVSEEDLSPEDALLFREINEHDERAIKTVERALRVRQSKFRKALLAAYSGKCVISEYGVPEALQAAHISSYMGPKSQTTTNGLLLRADLHLLYDSYLITVDPEGYRVRTAPKLASSPYAEFNRKTILKPQNPKDIPSEKRLFTHYSEFLLRNELYA